MKRQNAVLVILVALCLIPMGVCGYLQSLMGDGMVGEIDDLARYAEIRSQYSAYMQHFPETISADATGVKFHYHPAIMQGGAVIELRMQLPDEQVEQLVNEYSQKAILVIQDENIIQGEKDETFTHFPGIWTEADPPDLEEQFSIFFLNLEPLGGKDSPWNHGITYGAMFQPEERVVIYWIEEW